MKENVSLRTDDKRKKKKRQAQVYILTPKWKDTKDSVTIYLSISLVGL